MSETVVWVPGSWGRRACAAGLVGGLTALQLTSCSQGDGERETPPPPQVAAGGSDDGSAPATPPEGVTCAEPMQSSVSLAQSFADHFDVGAALAPSTFRSINSNQVSLVETHFNRVTAENDMKWSSIHPGPTSFSWTAADTFVEFAEQRGLQVHGHVLVWHQQTPDWVFTNDDGSDVSADVLWARVEEHIAAVAERYGGRVAYWDVVNEAFEDNGSLRDSKWRQILGDDYIAQTFQIADRLLPDSKLVYNDYSLFVQTKRDAVVAMVEDLKARGIRIDAVGMQGHYNLRRPGPEEVDAAITAYAGTGAEVLITELDLDVLPSEREIAGADLDATTASDPRLDPYSYCLPEEVEQQVAERWASLFEVFLRHSDSISSVTFWGVDDGGSWLNNWPVNGRTNYPLLFDRSQQPKPSFGAVVDQLAAE